MVAMSAWNWWWMDPEPRNRDVNATYARVNLFLPLTHPRISGMLQ